MNLRACICLVILAACVTASCQSPQKRQEPRTADEQSPTAGVGGFLKKVSPLELLSRLRPRREQPPAAALSLQIGTIRQVNIEGQFVLIDAQIATAVQAGDVLTTVANQKVTADLKLTPLRGGSFLIADILTGEPSVGDQVYRK